MHVNTWRYFAITNARFTHPNQYREYFRRQKYILEDRGTLYIDNL